MERSASVGGGNHFFSPSFSSSSMRHVNYSCGSCGYELNLSSTNRITSTIGSKYGKSMKSGIISFFNIDEGRFSQVDEFQCMPHFSRYSFGLFRRRTKLLCRKCNNYIGNASQEKAPEYALVTQNTDSTSPRSGSVTKYDIRIRSLQPSSAVASLYPSTTPTTLQTPIGARSWVPPRLATWVAKWLSTCRLLERCSPHVNSAVAVPRTLVAVVTAVTPSPLGHKARLPVSIFWR